MKKYILIVFIAILLPLTCLAGSIQDMHKAVIARKTVAAASYVTPDIFNERFENLVSPYTDETWSWGWDNTEGDITYQDDPADVGSPAAWQDQCPSISSTVGEVSTIAHNKNSGITELYGRLDIAVTDTEQTSEQATSVISLDDDSYSAPIRIRVFGGPSGAGYYVIKAEVELNGSDKTTYTSDNEYSEGTTPHRIEFYYKVNSAGGFVWKIDGVDQGDSGTTTSGAQEIDILSIGAHTAGNTITIYLDNFGLDSNEWIGEAAP